MGGRHARAGGEIDKRGHQKKPGREDHTFKYVSTYNKDMNSYIIRMFHTAFTLPQVSYLQRMT